MPMELGLADERGYPHRGQADYQEPAADPGTGTVRVRGIFPNPDGAILPGFFVRVRIPAGQRDDALLVPERALGTDQAGQFLLVVGKDDLVEYRPVKAGPRIDELRVVEGKIGPDDRVVVEGLLRARPRLKVDPDRRPGRGRQGRRRRRSPRLAPEVRPAGHAMLSRFFIERPIFANVIAIMTMIAGAVALCGLPIEQFPSITPPTVVVSTSYPGAERQVLSDAVASLIEQEINGVEGMLYMSSTCSNDGSYRLTVTFEIGTDLDKAQVLVQNRLAVALPRLPQEVQRLGVTAQKQSTNFLMAVALTSPDRRYDELFLGNYATLRIKNTLTRIRGVGNCDVFGGSRYGMRIWIDPEKLKARDLSTEDVLAAIREQNVQVAAGQVGQSPAPETQGFQYNVTTPGRLGDPEQFGDIIVKADDADPAGGPADPGARRGPRRAGRRGLRPVERDRRPVRRPGSASPCSPAPTRWTSPDGSRRPWRSSSRASPTAWNTRSPTTRRRSSRSRSARSTRR